MKEIILRRDKYFIQIIPFIDKDIIKVLVWQRRVWKSKLMLQIINYIKQKKVKSKVIYIDKENINFDHINNYKDLYNEVKDFDYIFIDEIQNIVDWEKCVLSLQNVWKDVYITWSNSNMLSSNLATNLRWRYIQIDVFPLDYTEFLQLNNFKNSWNNFNKYISFWWLPYLTNIDLKEELVNDYLKNILSTIVLHDIIERFNIRNVSFFNNLLKFVSLHIWSIFSSTNITAFLKNQNIKISPTTILDYLEYLKIAFVLNECPRYDTKWKKVFEIRQKYFFTDIWVRNIIVWWFRKIDISGILENIVFINLKSNWWDLKIWEIDWKEVDFVCEKNWNIMYLQVAYILENQETINRELASLKCINDNWPKFILTTDTYSKWEKIDWIEFKNISLFLLESI